MSDWVSERVRELVSACVHEGVSACVMKCVCLCVCVCVSLGVHVCVCLRGKRGFSSNCVNGLTGVGSVLAKLGLKQDWKNQLPFLLCPTHQHQMNAQKCIKKNEQTSTKSAG